MTEKQFDKFRCIQCGRALHLGAGDEVPCPCGGGLVLRNGIYRLRQTKPRPSHGRPGNGKSDWQDTLRYTRRLWDAADHRRMNRASDRDWSALDPRHTARFLRWYAEGMPYEDVRWWYSIVPELAHDFTYGPERLIARILDLLPSQSRCALDLGSGTGIFAARMAHRCEQIVACDPMTSSMEFNERRFRWILHPSATFVLTGAEYLPFQDAAFDCASVGGMLHWTNPFLSFDELARVLQPGARTVGYTALRGDSATCEYVDARGGYTFGREEIEDFFAKAGFVDLETEIRGDLIIFSCVRR